MSDGNSYDIVVVGGGPAGLSAALVLGRARRSTLVVDAGAPANAVSESVGGLLGHEGSPVELRRSAAEQVLNHPSVELREGEIAAAARSGDGFLLTLGDERIDARTILLAHGLLYSPPPIDGAVELWGTGVLHCPFCDGWEVRDRPLGVYGSDERSVNLALLAAGWSDDTILFSDGADEAVLERADELAASGVRVRPERVVRLDGSGGRLESVVLEGGVNEPREALFVVPELSQPSGLADELGLEITDTGLIAADPDGRTTVSGVYVAGDAAASLRSVAIAIGTGARASKALVLDLA
jgi:thioredoxin reductase